MKRIALAVLLVGIGLRVGLTLVNLAANDDHLEVVELIVDEGVTPHWRDVFEGHQPKLWHETVAALWRLGDVTDDVTRIRVAQWTSCLAGILTLLLARRFLRETALPPAAELSAFALLALNPSFVGINAQATNDSFVILFATCTLYAGWRWLRSWRPAWLAATVSAAILAQLSKAHALVAVVAVLAAAGLAFLSRERAGLPSRPVLVGAVAGFAVVFVGFVGAFGEYRETWDRSGSPFEVNLERNPFPPLLPDDYEPTCETGRLCWRYGNRSLVTTYLSAPMWSLLRDPILTQDPVDYPVNRTSFWTRVYGSAHSVRYEQWPPEWADRGGAVRWLARVTYVVAVAPTAVLAWGLVRSLAGVVRRRLGLGESMLALAAAGYLAFLVVMTTTYRDFSNMKAIILLPGVVAFAWVFGSAMPRWLVPFVAALCGLYVVDSLLLIEHLR